MQYLDRAALYVEMERLRGRIGPIPKALPHYKERVGQLCPDITLICREFDSRRLAGMLMRGETATLLVLNSARGELAQRFTLTHELVHYFLHTDQVRFCCEDAGAGPYEWQANEGAAELLVPYRSFLKEVRCLHAQDCRDLDEVYARLSMKYHVSPVVIKNRMESLSFEIDDCLRGAPATAIVPKSRARHLRDGDRIVKGFRVRKRGEIDIYKD